MSATDGSTALAVVDALFGLFGDMRQSMHMLLSANGATGLAPMDLRVLQLCAREAGLTQQILVRRTGRDKGQIANLVRNLCAEGMLERRAHPEDKRSHSLHATPEGLKVARRFEKLGAELGIKLLGNWSSKEVSAFLGQVEGLRVRIAAQT